MERKKGVVIGGGTMGADIAAMFIGNGQEVDVVEIDADVRGGIPGRVAVAADEIGGKFSSDSLRVVDSVGKVNWAGATIVIECVFEDLVAKQEIFAELEEHAPPHLPITSNSSGIPISRIADGRRSAGRMAGLHFFMPGHLVPCVEVIRGERTESEVLDNIFMTMVALGKRPVRVQKDVPGFLANRIQHALMREAISLVEQGFASVEDVDTAVRYGFGFRYVAAGPLLQKDLSGIDIHCAAAETMYPHLCNEQVPSIFIRNLVDEGKYGVKTKQGFYEWDEESIACARARYKASLQQALDILRSEAK